MIQILVIHFFLFYMYNKLHILLILHKRLEINILNILIGYNKDFLIDIMMVLLSNYAFIIPVGPFLHVLLTEFIIIIVV